jgi:hypothetical protein
MAIKALTAGETDLLGSVAKVIGTVTANKMPGLTNRVRLHRRLFEKRRVIRIGRINIV